MSGIIKKIFIVLLTNIVNGSNHAECVSLTLFRIGGGGSKKTPLPVFPL